MRAASASTTTRLWSGARRSRGSACLSAASRDARWLVRILLFALVLALLAPLVVPPFLDRVYYRGPVSNHFNGERFFNPDGGDSVAGGSHNLPRTFLRFMLG